MEADELFRVAVTNAMENGSVMLIRNAIMQEARTQMTAWSENDIEARTGVCVVLLGATSHEQGAVVIMLDTDDIDNLCSELQKAKAGPVLKEDDSLGHIQVRFGPDNQQQPGE